MVVVVVCCHLGVSKLCHTHRRSQVVALASVTQQGAREIQRGERERGREETYFAQTSMKVGRWGSEVGSGSGAPSIV